LRQIKGEAKNGNLFMTGSGWHHIKQCARSEEMEKTEQNKTKINFTLFTVLRVFLFLKK
jgi:hypothetical protein